MIDINNTKSLPGEDEKALAEHQGLSTYEFKHSAGASFRSWEQYYKSLLADPYDYYRDNFAGRPIFRYVQTHPDMDHMSGLHRFFWQERVNLINFWDVKHNKELAEDSFEHGKYAYIDWAVYQCLRLGVGPDDSGGDSSRHKVINAQRGDLRSYWSDDGIQILSPTSKLIDECNECGDYNDCSYVLKFTHAGRNVVLPGDAEKSSWEAILASHSKEDLRCDVLKASHHGRMSGYHKEAVECMAPHTVICSVGKKPTTDASVEYSKVASRVLSTRYNGTIKVKIWDDGDIWIYDHTGSRIAVIDS
ncbi:ComEC/Rec2 family competence protein [Streptomyces sp. SS162]|uniref:ComEC/Rec2 family competence protein n=1 Tax=Streptomyces sp. SS162 TaxID=3108484 RepID=UPI002F3E2092